MSHAHHHHHAPADGRDSRLVLSILLNLTITVAEVIGGFLSGSLALLSDALHNLSDTLSLAVALVARKLAGRAPTAAKTFGYQRAEIIGAFVNLITLVLIALFLMKEAVERVLDPAPVDGPVMLIVASIGLVANVLTAFLLWRDARHSLNLRAAFLHITTDAVSSLAVVAGGVLILWYDAYLLDPVLSFLISVYILYQSARMLRGTVDILMESTPEDLDLTRLTTAMERLQEVLEVHHVHVWRLDEHHTALEAHVVIAEQDLLRMEDIKYALKGLLADRFDIRHSTLEFECVPCADHPDPRCYEQPSSL